jgi:hypothetical protein
MTQPAPVRQFYERIDLKLVEVDVDTGAETVADFLYTGALLDGDAYFTLCKGMLMLARRAGGVNR